MLTYGAYLWRQRRRLFRFSLSARVLPPSLPADSFQFHSFRVRCNFEAKVRIPRENFPYSRLLQENFIAFFGSCGMITACSKQFEFKVRNLLCAIHPLNVFSLLIRTQGSQSRRLLRLDI